MDEHKETRRVLKETTEHLNEKTSKYEALQQHYIEQVALDNAEEYAAFMYYGLATAEAKRLEEDLLDSLKRYERARLTIDRVEMEAAEEFSNGLEGNGKRGRSRGRSRGSSRKSSRALLRRAFGHRGLGLGLARHAHASEERGLGDDPRLVWRRADDGVHQWRFILNLTDAPDLDKRK